MEYQVGYEAAGAGALIAVNLVSLLVSVLVIASMWKVFAKAGLPGWAALIPIFNIVVWLQMVGRPIWWLALLFVPFVNFVVTIIITLDVARVFGKGSGFGLGLVFLPFAFYPILGFGDARYQGAHAPLV